MAKSLRSCASQGRGFAALCFLCVLAALSWPTSLSAQLLPQGQVQILTISTDRLFADSQFGRRVTDEIEAESAVLAAENERIIGELSREEGALTDRRASMEPEAFRLLADAFDQKVQENRANQKAKLDALAVRTDQAQAIFFEAARPVLENLMRETGAGIVLERSGVFLSADSTDITQLAIARIDAAIGDGTSLSDQ